MPFKVYKGTDNTGTLLTASNIEFTGILDAKSTLSFTHDGTTALAAYDDIFCEYSYDGTTKEAFLGYIEEPPQSAVPPQAVTCTGFAGKMDWYIVEETHAKTIKDQGLVKQVNGGDNTKLDLYDDDGNAIADTTPYANVFTSNPQHYLIVSDNTKGSDTEVLENGANNWVGYDNDFTCDVLEETGDHEDVKCAYSAANHWDFQKPDAGASTPVPVNGTAYKLGIGLGLENYGIAITNTLTKIRIKIWVDITIGTQTDVNVKNIAHSYLYFGDTKIATGPSVVSSTGGPVTAGFITEVEFDLTKLNDTYFTEGVANWEDGWVWVGIKEKNYTTAAYTGYALSMKWYALAVELDYESATFDQLNDPITDTEVGDTIGCDTRNYSTAGVTANDRWAVGIDYNQALQDCFVAQGPIASPAIDCVIHAGASIGLGSAKNFFGCTGWEMLTQLIEQIEYHVWEDFVGKLVNVDNYAGMGAAIALDVPGVESMAFTERAAVQYVYVIWKDGVIAAATGASGAQSIIKVQDEGILTEAEAWDRGTKLAAQYANPSYAVSCKYTGTPLVANGDLPRVGKRYTVSLYNSDGTSIEYATQPCRRVTIRNSGGDEVYETDVFIGTGSTPWEEKIVKEILKVKKEMAAQQFKRMSSTYTPVTRHSALNGVAGSADQYHVSSTQYSDMLLHADVDDVAVNAADTVPISSNWAYDHENNTTTAHGAVSANTASKLVVRDASARAQFADPSAAQDAATKAYVDVKRVPIQMFPSLSNCSTTTNLGLLVQLNYTLDHAAVFYGTLPSNLKTSGKVSFLVTAYIPGNKVGATLILYKLTLTRRNTGTGPVTVNNWNGEAGDTYTHTATSHAANDGYETFTILADSTAFSANDQVYFSLLRNTADTHGATTYLTIRMECECVQP